MPALCSDYLVRLAQRQAHGFLDENMLAGIERSLDDLGVIGMGIGDQHHVDVRLLDQGAVIAEAVGDAPGVAHGLQHGRAHVA